MLNETQQHNQRQFKLMLGKINYHKNNKISHKHLLASLEALTENLHEVDVAWKEEFSTLCNRLDYSYLNLHDDSLDEETRAQEKIRIDQYINRLIELIQSRIIDEQKL